MKYAFRNFCRDAVADGIPGQALIWSLLIGSLLNLINQGNVIFGHGQPNLIKMALTYAVPYCSATYGAVTQKRRRRQTARQAEAADP